MVSTSFLSFILSCQAHLYLVTSNHSLTNLYFFSETFWAKVGKSKDTLNLVCSEMNFVISFCSLTFFNIERKAVPFTCQSHCPSCQQPWLPCPTAFRLTLLTTALATSPLKILQWSPSSCRVTSEILSIFNCFVSCSTEVTQGHMYARQILHQYAMGLALMFSGGVNPDSISPLTGKALRGAYDVAHTGRSRTTLRSLFSLPPLHGVQGRSKVSKLMQQVLLLAWPSCWPLTKI